MKEENVKQMNRKMLFKMLLFYILYVLDYTIGV